jgi:hypothetical protein
MDLSNHINDVISKAEEPLDCEQIAVELAERGHIGNFGVIPRKLICSVIEDAIAKEGDQCPIVRTEPGVYVARKLASPEDLRAASSLPSEDVFNSKGIITCYGPGWLRDVCDWNPTPLDFIGCQYRQSPKIDFSNQVGVYALSSKPPGKEECLVYTGVTFDRTIGECLHGHTQDRLSGRWNQFSFYGLLPINEDGTFGSLPHDCTMADTMASLQSILVEVATPPANRRSFDYFSTLEFIQLRYWEIQAVNNFVASVCSPVN